jgi:hypothetical protein
LYYFSRGGLEENAWSAAYHGVFRYLSILGWEEERGIDGFSASSWAWIMDGLDLPVALRYTCTRAVMSIIVGLL